MNYSIGKTISKSIKENKWLSIEYVNKNKEESKFWCAILDIIIERKLFVVDIFNIFKGNNTINTMISYENIKSAKVLDGTYYLYESSLINKIEKNINELSWLEFDSFNDKILEYYSEAKKLDVDPYQNDYSNITGIDTKILLDEKCIKLNDVQFKKNQKIYIKIMMWKGQIGIHSLLLIN